MKSVHKMPIYKDDQEKSVFSVILAIYLLQTQVCVGLQHGEYN